MKDVKRHNSMSLSQLNVLNMLVYCLSFCGEPTLGRTGTDKEAEATKCCLKLRKAGLIGVLDITLN